MTALKPCPFCGKHAASGPHDTVQCINQECPIYGRIFRRESWNRRAISPEIAGALREAKEALKYYAENMVVPHGDKARAALARIEAVTEKK